MWWMGDVLIRFKQIVIIEKDCDDWNKILWWLKKGCDDGNYDEKYCDDYSSIVDDGIGWVLYL